MLGLYPTPKSPSLSKSVFGKKEECVSAGMELLRRMEYGGMFPCLILLLFMEFTLDVE
jgi:hypothetical protein